MFFDCPVFDLDAKLRRFIRPFGKYRYGFFDLNSAQGESSLNTRHITQLSKRGLFSTNYRYSFTLAAKMTER